VKSDGKKKERRGKNEKGPRIRQTKGAENDSLLRYNWNSSLEETGTTLDHTHNENEEMPLRGGALQGC